MAVVTISGLRPDEIVIVAGTQSDLTISVRARDVRESANSAISFAESASAASITMSAASEEQWCRVARLARIAIDEAQVAELVSQLNSILRFVDQLSEVDVSGVEPMTSVTPMAMKKRADKVTDGGIAEDIVRNAPATEDNFFLVPKVVE